MHDSSPKFADADRPTQVRWLIFSLACGMSFLLYLHRYTWGFVKKDVRDEFGWDPPTLGWLDGLFGISYGVGQIPAGAVCDWCGARILLGASILSWSLALATVALATGLISMAIGRVIFGVAQAGCYPALNKVSKNWFAARRWQTASAPDRSTPAPRRGWSRKPPRHSPRPTNSEWCIAT